MRVSTKRPSAAFADRLLSVRPWKVMEYRVPWFLTRMSRNSWDLLLLRRASCSIWRARGCLVATGLFSDGQLDQLGVVNAGSISAYHNSGFLGAPLVA